MNPDKEKYPLISIVTLNWNRADVTCEFLESTRKLTYPNYEIVVCDMNSEEDPIKIEQGNYPYTRLLRSDKNLGFPAGNNWGIRQVTGDYIFIVNNDTEVTPDLLERLLEPFRQDDSIGVTCPKIRYFYSENSNVIQYAGYNPMNFFTGKSTSVGYGEQDRGQFDHSGPTNGAHGCAMMVSRKVIEKTGMFPESFFLYYEEWDWSTRIRVAGFKIWYEGKALILHKESVSVGKMSPLKIYYMTRNRILFMRRNCNPLQLATFFLFFTFFTLPKSVIVYTLRKKNDLRRSFLKGVFDNLKVSSHSPV
jgi:GT2 family glycosyltransferase